MTEEMHIVTDGQSHDVVYGYQLDKSERKEFDYIDWVAVDSGLTGATFFRYEGELYDLGEFSRDFGIVKNTGLPVYLSQWDGYMSLTAFSTMLVKFTDDDESVIVGHIYN